MAKYTDWGLLGNLEGATASGRLSGELTALIPATASLSESARRDAAIAELLARNVLNLTDFGVVGDGVANDTAAFLLAVAATPAGGVLAGSPGSTYLLDPVVITKSLTLILYGCTIKTNSASDQTGTICFKGSYPGTTTTLTAGVSDGALAIPVTSAASFPSGTWCRIEDLSATVTDFAFEWHKVKLVSGNTLYLHDPLGAAWSYPSGANGEVSVWSPVVNPVVLGGTFDGNGLPSTAINFAPLAFVDCVGAEARGVTVHNFRLYGIMYSRCRDYLCDGPYIYESSADLSVATSPDGGYGVEQYGSIYGTVSNGRFMGMRHAIDGSNGARYWKAIGNTCIGQFSAAITTHFRRAVDMAVVGNTVVGCTPRSFSNTTLPLTTAQGIVVSITDSRVTITGNTVSHILGPGIRCAQNSFGVGGHLTITNNTLTDCYTTDGSVGTGSIYVAYMGDVILHGNVIRRTDALTVTFSGFRITGCQDVSIVGNNVHFTSAQNGATIQIGFWNSDSTRVRWIGNHVTIDGAVCRGFYTSGTAPGDSTDVVYTDNVASVTSGGSKFLADANSTNVRHRDNSWNMPNALSTDRGDANVTLTTADEAEQLFATTLTANRTVALPSAGMVRGERIRVVRTGLGAFTLDVGGLKTIPSATAAFVDVEYSGSAWKLIGYGTL